MSGFTGDSRARPGWRLLKTQPRAVPGSGAAGPEGSAVARAGSAPVYAPEV